MMDKAELRREMHAKRAQAHALGQGRAAEILADHLAQYGGRALAGYMPMRSEIDPLPAMARHRGPVGVPVIEARAQPLRFRAWGPQVEMVAGAFGADIPATGDWIDPEILIVPLLAFDARGFRLGYGGGFYDRTLEGLRARHAVLAIGFAFDAQEVAEVPTEPTDQPLDALVTPSGLRLFTRA